MESKQQARKDPVFKDTEIRYQKELELSENLTIAPLLSFFAG